MEIEKFDKLSKVLESHKFLSRIESKTGVPKMVLFFGGSLLSISLFLRLTGWAYLFDSIAFVYPALKSLDAIEKGGPNDHIQWLMYWVVYSLIQLGDKFLHIFVFWIPAFWLWKFLFLLWCFLPYTQGSSIVYSRFIAPFLSHHEKQIDNAAVNVKKRVLNEMVEVGSELAPLARDLATSVASSVIQARVSNQIDKALNVTPGDEEKKTSENVSDLDSNKNK